MAFLLGFVIGFISSLPPSGPVSVLVLRHVFMGQGSRARWVGWGRIVPESAAAFLACVGITAAEVYAPWLSTALSWTGAGILFVLAVWFLSGRAAPKTSETISEDPVKKKGRDFITGLSLSGLNPTLLVTWPTVISMLVSAKILNAAQQGWVLAAGVGLGIFVSYFVIGAMAPVAKKHLSPVSIARSIRVIGVLLLVLVGLFIWRIF